MSKHARKPSLEAALLFILALAIGLSLSVYLYSGPNPFYDDMTYILLSRSAISNGMYFLLDRFGFGLHEGVMYYSKFNRDYTFKTINYPILASNNSLACNVPSGEAFLVDLYTYPLERQNLAMVDSWLGSNCTAEYLKNFDTDTPVSNTTIKVYHIEPIG